ncbi:MAG: hypothetical protein KJN90_05735 [Gammaproteobacteria bacterium]|nr:hypothetical protein [Gammaproteobacteria bacterium]
MIYRNTYKLLLVLILSLFACYSVNAQVMPPGNLIVTTACTINHGHTVDEVIRVARAIDSSGEGGPNLVFYRRPIAGANFPSDLIMRVIYWDDMAHWASAGGAPPSGPRSYLSDMLSCDTVNRTFSTNRNVGQGAAYAGGENTESLVATRNCRIKPGNTLEQLYFGLLELNAPYGQQGDTTLMQLSQRIMGPREGVEMGQDVIIRLIGEDAVGLAERIDMSPSPAGTPADAPVENCRDWALWQSYVTHWGL